MQIALFNTAKDKTKWWISIFLFIVSLLIRIIKLATDPLLMRDAANYLLMAERWFDSNNYDLTFRQYSGVVVPPLPVWIIKQTMIFGFGSEITGRAINLFAGSIIPVVAFILFYNISRRIKLSTATGLLISINPNLVSCSIQPLRENLYLVFCIIALVYLTKSSKGIISGLYCLWGAVFCILSIFCRYEAFELIPLCIAIILLHFKTHRSLPLLINNLICYGIGMISSSIIFFYIIGCDLSFINRIRHFF